MERHAKQLQSKSRIHQVTEVAGQPNAYDVTSGHSGKVYRVLVNPDGAFCTCDWAAYRPMNDHRSACSHTIAVYDHIAQQESRRASAWASEQEARRQHKPVTQIGDGVLVTMGLRGVAR